MRGVLSLEPPDLVDLLFDLEALQVVELGLVALKMLTSSYLPLFPIKIDKIYYKFKILKRHAI